MSIPKNSNSRSLSSFESLEGPPTASSESLANGTIFDEVEGARDPTEECLRDPEATEAERGTDPECEPKEAER